ncbi:helix-turn-helix domain-containing protein, partial [Vibrio parahaemolyticus]|nr:helix-turn-helix domain-containing protein [Vibrio parahaemolyticus]
SFITQRLRHFRGDRAKTADSLGIPKRTLAYKCQKWEIY